MGPSVWFYKNKQYNFWKKYRFCPRSADLKNFFKTAFGANYSGLNAEVLWKYEQNRYSCFALPMGSHNDYNIVVSIMLILLLYIVLWEKMKGNKSTIAEVWAGCLVLNTTE